MQYPRSALLALIVALTAAAPARAEQLLFDYRLHPVLTKVLAENDPAMVFYENAAPDHVLDVIAVQGKSAHDWTEALEILVKPHPRKLTAITEWYAGWQAAENQSCPSTWQVLATDANSITFARGDAKCAALAGQSRVQRAVIGKKDVFLLGGFYRGEMGAERRGQWLALLASARLAP